MSGRRPQGGGAQVVLPRPGYPTCTTTLEMRYRIPILPFRSPLLRETHLLAFPLPIDMLKFGRYLSDTIRNIALPSHQPLTAAAALLCGGGTPRVDRLSVSQGASRFLRNLCDAIGEGISQGISTSYDPPQGTPPSKVNDFASQDNWGRAALDTNPRATVSLPGDTFH